jgi:hypothetical protein
MPRHLPCLAFLLLVLCRAASSAHHPCERVAKAKAAELPLAAFASACSHAGTLQAHGALHSLHDARVYACVPLVLDKLRNGERSFASVPLSDDPLQHLFGSESFLGRAERADSTEQYAIDFLSAAGEAALLHGFVCYPGLLTGLQPAETGILSNGAVLRNGYQTVTEQLAASGYRTGAFVSSFAVDADTGLGQGFQVYDDDFFPFLRGITQVRDGLASLSLQTWHC